MAGEERRGWHGVTISGLNNNNTAYPDNTIRDVRHLHRIYAHIIFFLSAEKLPSRLICLLLDLISPSHDLRLYTQLPEPPFLDRCIGLFHPPYGVHVDGIGPVEVIYTQQSYPYNHRYK
jgi:hypothetical protein